MKVGLAGGASTNHQVDTSTDSTVALTEFVDALDDIQRLDDEPGHSVSYQQAVAQANSYTNSQIGILRNWAGKGISSAQSTANSVSATPIVAGHLSAGIGYGQYAGYGDGSVTLRYTAPTQHLVNFSASVTTNGGFSFGTGMVF